MKYSNNNYPKNPSPNKLVKSGLTVFAAVTLSLSVSVQAIVPEPAAKQSKPIAITGVTAHIGNGEVITDATIAFDKGIISFIGKNNAFVNAEKHDTLPMTGKHVYPGFILPNTQLGLVEVNAVRATRDQAERTQLNPSIRSISSYNTDSELIPTFRFNGILTAQIKPAGGLISGLSSLVSLDGWNWEDAAFATDTAMHINWPSIYSRKFDYATHTVKTEKNKHYQEQVDILTDLFQSASLYNASSKPNLKLAAAKKVLDGKVQFFIHTDGAREIVNGVKFAKSHGIKNIVIVGAREALIVADFIKQENVPVILSGVHMLPSSEDADIDQAYKLPFQLTQAGIKVAIGSSLAIEPQGARNLAFGAGRTVGYGLTKEQALSLITKNVAEILGVSHRIGTLEVGKEATLFVSQGDALDMRGNQLLKAYIQGRDIDLFGTQQQLYERYKNKYSE